jgi:hypothetical protein
MSDVLPQIEPETSGQVTQFDSGHSGDLVFKVAAVLVIVVVIVCVWWVFNPRTGDPSSKLKSPFIKFRSLFKKEWTWRLFMILQVAGIIGVAYLAMANDNNWHLFPYTRLDDETVWDFNDSQFWTGSHENWLVVLFLVGPLLMTKAIDWVFATKGKTAPIDSWKNN